MEFIIIIIENSIFFYTIHLNLSSSSLHSSQPPPIPLRKEHVSKKQQWNVTKYDTITQSKSPQSEAGQHNPIGGK